MYYINVLHITVSSRMCYKSHLTIMDATSTSFSLSVLILIGMQNIFAAGIGITEEHTLINDQVNLTCQPNSTGYVTWWYDTNFGENSIFKIYSCGRYSCAVTTSKQLKEEVNDNFIDTHTSIRNGTFILSVKPSKEGRYNFECRGQNYVQEYSIKSINQSKVAPSCSLTLPRNNLNGVGNMSFSCEVNSIEVNGNLTILGTEDNFLHDIRGLGKNAISNVLYFNDFINVYNATCNAYFPDINLTLSCSYPNVLKAQGDVEGNDIIVDCDHTSDFETEWRLYNQNGIEEDIRNRSWSRKGGRSLLIKDLSQQDEGKVVVCRTTGVNETNNGTIGFAVISNIPGDSSSPDSKTDGRTPTSGDQHNIFLVLTLLFLCLWVVTTVVGGVFYWVITKKTKSDTPVIATSSPSGYVSGASNGRSNEHETPLSSDGARGRCDPDTTNTNNSAHNPDFEPETISIDGNRRNRQGNDGNHLYFTLEKSSPSPKASTSRQERPGSSMNHPKGSQWQGYETVGDPNKGVFCSFDLGEYADISFQGKVTSDLSEYSEVDATQFRGTAPPGAGEYSEVRRSFRGKEQPTLPDRNFLNKIPKGEQVERDEISRLYGKVKK